MTTTDPAFAILQEPARPTFYEGSAWLKQHLARKQIEPSPLALRVASLLGELVQGIYHIDDAVDSAGTDWTNPRRVQVCVRGGYVSWCTVDSNFLTRLVFHSHDYGLRVELSPRTFKHLVLEFWQRDTRDPAESLSVRCPTIEDALAQHRQNYPAPRAPEVTDDRNR